MNEDIYAGGGNAGGSTEECAGDCAGERAGECAEERAGGIEMNENQECCPCYKTKQRSEKEYRDLLNRLSRIEGQIRGIRGMVERGVYCIDILTQAAAANAALNSFTRVLLVNHIKTCVTDDILAGKEEAVDELAAALQKLMK